MDQFMTTTELVLAQLSCVQNIEDHIDDMEAHGVEVPDALKAQVASMRAHVNQYLLEGTAEDLN